MLKPALTNREKEKRHRDGMKSFARGRALRRLAEAHPEEFTTYHHEELRKVGFRIIGHKPIWDRKAQ